MKPPEYFNGVETESREMWDVLESKPKLRAPWDHLFRQVQSPRHVVSELLQNADDARATKAWVRIESGKLIFQHNGRDFVEEEFASLCRFGFSNKRHLHTIGFRGIGFKSTFSVGDPVEVSTPTLSVRFTRKRFTYPEWVSISSGPELTTITVPIANDRRQEELDRNCREWLESPTSLLFFRSLREFNINGQTVRRQVLEKGPVPNSRRVRLSSQPNASLLLITSDPLALPQEAVQEIQEERQVEDLHLPEIQIELVLGLEGDQKLFVVLPTEVAAPLPFSCNAPFLPKSTRDLIKDPATSFTNEWLLRKAGQLAAEAMLGWLQNQDLPIAERAKAYQLFPQSNATRSGLADSCAALARESFLETVGAKPVLLTAGGGMVKSGDCLAIPAELHDIWTPRQATEIFGTEETHLLTSEVSDQVANLLSNEGWITSVSARDVVERLAKTPRPPKPSNWNAIGAIWHFIESQPNYIWYNQEIRNLNILPAKGESQLYSANEVVRLSSRLELLKQEDWEFLSGQSRALDPDYLQWLTKRPDDENGKALRTLLQTLGLHEASTADRVAAAASHRLFSPDEIDNAEAIRLTQIFAALKAPTPDGFYFCNQNNTFIGASDGLLYDPSGTMRDILPEQWAKDHTLDDAYYAEFMSCTSHQWDAWLASGQSKLSSCVMPSSSNEQFWSRRRVEEFLERRGSERKGEYRYKRENFEIVDFDFPEEVVEHWKALAAGNANVWWQVLVPLLKAPPSTWKEMMHARIRQLGTSYAEALTCTPIPAAWVARFRELPCLPDQDGKARLPSELLLLNPDTESHRGIEPFVSLELDTQENRPLLEMLGVRTTPTDADKVINRLFALSKAAEPERLIVEINKLYEALDRIVARCALPELQHIIERVRKEPLILSETKEWVTAGEISVYTDEDGTAPAIHHSCQRLSMWLRLGIPERPAFSRTLEWIQTLPSGGRPDSAVVSRLKIVLRREPERIWRECQHWLSLDQTWEPVANLRFRLTMQGLLKWGDLIPGVKRATANLQLLSEAIWQQPPFSQLQDLGDAIRFKIGRFESSKQATHEPWLSELGNGLSRIVLSDERSQTRIRDVAQRLRSTAWQEFDLLELIPYVDEAPAGAPITPRVAWLDSTLYVMANQTMARLHKEITDELGRPFIDSALREAISACIARESDYVAEYLANQFEIDQQLQLTVNPKATENGQGQNSSEVKPTDGSSTKEDANTKSAGQDGEDEQVNGQSGNDADDASSDGGGDEDNDEKPRRKSPAHKPGLMEIYAKQHGFRFHDGEKCFIHPDGRSIEKSKSPFNWEEHTAGGEVISRMWVADQRLANGVEIPAELWSLIGQQPNSTAMIIASDDHSPCALTGQELLELKDSRQITLHPARYRIIEAEQS